MLSSPACERGHIVAVTAAIRIVARWKMLGGILSNSPRGPEHGSVAKSLIKTLPGQSEFPLFRFLQAFNC
jgi:hypothetical protein